MTVRTVSRGDEEEGVRDVKAAGTLGFWVVVFLFD